MECVYAVDELNAQIKELQQQKLDNITEEFETIAGYSEAVQGTSKAMVDYYTSIGRTVNSGEAKGQYNKQIKEQQKIVGYYRQERDAYAKELQNAKKIFGENSNEYRQALSTYEEINTAYVEAQSAVNNLRKELYELDLTKIERVIDRLTAFGERFASIVTLKEARGTMYGQPSSAITQQDYSRQITTNNDLISKYMEDRAKRMAEIVQEGWQVDSDNYKEAYDAIVKDEEAIMNLLTSNEQLKDSIREVRWKPFVQLHEQYEILTEDLEHIRGLMKDAEWFDESGTNITDKGYTNIALLSREIYTAEKEIANYRVALSKLDTEYKNGNISLEEYNETSREYTKTIQDEVNGVQQLRDQILEMYKSQITAENKLLQENVQARKSALAQKKA